MTSPELGRIVLVVAVLALIVVGGVFAAVPSLTGFDGKIGPGCDWGSRYCDAGDYHYMCATYDGSTLDARWQTYCKDRR